MQSHGLSKAGGAGNKAAGGGDGPAQLFHGKVPARLPGGTRKAVDGALKSAKRKRPKGHAGSANPREGAGREEKV
jgi:hypothetical protein